MRERVATNLDVVAFAAIDSTHDVVAGVVVVACDVCVAFVHGCVCVYGFVRLQKLRGSNKPPKLANFSGSISIPPSLNASRMSSLPPSLVASLCPGKTKPAENLKIVRAGSRLKR